MKGQCEVNNIELDEVVLMNLLELPVWLRLTRATCNSVSIKVIHFGIVYFWDFCYCVVLIDPMDEAEDCPYCFSTR